MHADALFEGFLDLTYAYRFGPPGHDVVAATLRDRATGAILAAAHGFPCGLPTGRDSALGLVARAEPIANGYALVLQVDRFAHAVAVEAEGFVPDDNFLHLEPGEPRRLVLSAEVPGQPLRASVCGAERRRPCGRLARSLTRRRPMLVESAAAGETPAERPRYIAHGGRYLFAWHHPAQPAVRRGAAVVLCPPLGSDYIGVYRVWRILAERLAGIGFDVLRFDYEGTGDSAGDSEEPGRLEAWIGNIERVVKEARELAGSSEVALVGLRIGATLALQAAAAWGGVDRLVLWSPFRSGRAYVRELKAFSRLSRKDYVTEIDQGPDILAAGYVLPGAVARALEGLDLNALSSRTRAPRPSGRPGRSLP